MPLPEGPDQIYGPLFEAVQLRHVFDDSKTFADATPVSDTAVILDELADVDTDDPAAIAAFVERHFRLPEPPDAPTASPADVGVRERIDALWPALTRAADKVEPNSSLIELPRPYIVPGGRFREIYYWDSYFTMLGLADAGRFDTIEDMVENFAYLINRVGFIPNGNRTYFCTRSQPPFFVLMVELLADVRQDPGVFDRYYNELEREYAFWMSGSDTVTEPGDVSRRVVRVGDGYLNRYWDDSDRPRPESYAEDREQAANANVDESVYCRNIRAAAESGWDFSSRWLEDPAALASIRTTTILPVDLNALLCRLEYRLAHCGASHDAARAADYEARAKYRLHQLQTLFFDDERGFFADVDIASLEPTPVLSLAASYPLFLEQATPLQAERVVARIHDEFLAPGGWLTTLVQSGQQWDRPNGWAPLQWITYMGMCNYGFDDEAREGASRWVNDNIDVYRRTGRLLEKYDVERVDSLASGGEYTVQDGFGWTNGVLLRLMNRLNIS